MDRLIYTAMTGAKHVMEQQATTSNNLANATTTGFRAQLDSFRAVPVISDAPLNTRTFVVDSTVGADFSGGPIQQTGNDLDVAVNGKGWLTAQMPDGSEGYTRAGNLRINENGILSTQSGLPLMGDGGPLTIPPDMKVSIGKDGTVSVIPTTGAATVAVVGRLKLVNPNEQDLVRGEDGYFRNTTGNVDEIDPSVTLTAGAIEGSNVNVVDAMVNMINLGRQFDMQMKLIQTAESNENKASSLFSLNG